MTKVQLYKLIIHNLCNTALSMFELFVKAIPLGIVCGLITKVLICKYHKSRSFSISTRKENGIVFLVIYIMILLQITIIFRTHRVIRQIDIIPFDTPGGISHIVLYALMNSLIFLPVGILLPMIWERMNNLKKILLVGFLGSLFIELSQLIFQCGVCQTEDLIMNTLGAGIGYWMYKKTQKKDYFCKKSY